jgi:nucleotide-binding universal stress UspA family protein
MYKRILIPVDGSETSTKALVAGLQLARESGGRVRLIHVLDELAFISDGYGPVVDLLKVAEDGANKVLADALEQAKAAGVPADTKLVEQAGARLGEVIADEARAWEALAPVPVLAVRSKEQPTS